MELTVEQEEKKLKGDLYKVLASLDKCVNEKDLRKAYRDKIGHNVNIVIEKIKAGNFLHFMRFKCRDFCEVDKLDGVHRVHRLFEKPAESEEPKNHKKKHKSNAAPKLNFPRVGLINSSTFPRLNPQGFNKGKSNKEGKSLVSLPYYQPKYPLAYRSEAQLTKFKKSQSANVPYSEPLSYEEENYVYDRSYAEAIAAQTADAAAAAKMPAASPPRVKNPFDFPSLPMKPEAAEEDSDTDSEHHEESSCEEGEEEEEEEDEAEEQVQSSVEAAEKILERMRNLTMRETCTASNFYPQLDLDDPIFRFEFPPVVTDPLFNIPSPEMSVLEGKIYFEVNLTVVYSPAQFWFQYGDASLYVLMNRMKAFYSNLIDGDLCMSASSMQPGLVVAAKVMTSWHRAQVVSPPNCDGQVGLFFLDFGTRGLVHVSHIRYMLKTFTDTPVKALRGSMAGALPATGQSGWSYSPRKAFFEFVANKNLFASIRYSRNGGNVHTLELTDQNNFNMRIAQLLVRLGLAVPELSYESHTYAIPLPVAPKKTF